MLTCTLLYPTDRIWRSLQIKPGWLTTPKRWLPSQHVCWRIQSTALCISTILSINTVTKTHRNLFFTTDEASAYCRTADTNWLLHSSQVGTPNHETHHVSHPSMCLTALQNGIWFIAHKRWGKAHVALWAPVWQKLQSWWVSSRHQPLKTLLRRKVTNRV